MAESQKTTAATSDPVNPFDVAPFDAAAMAAECVDAVMGEPGVEISFAAGARLARLFLATLNLAYAHGQRDGSAEQHAATMKLLQNYGAVETPDADSSGGQVLP